MRKIWQSVGRLFLFATSMLCTLTYAQEQGQRVQFVACPIVRDTATVPCWLTRYDDTLYYMGIQSDVSADFQPPLQGHQVLVEGVVGSEMICGGVVLEDIKVSTMPELDGSCNTMLPAEERYVIEVYPRPPGPSGGRLAFQANIDPPVLEPSVGQKTFTLYFDFDKGVTFRQPRDLTAIMSYAGEINATRVEIQAYYARHQLSVGQALDENPAVARRRAEQLAELLQGAGLEAEFSVNWSTTPRTGNGVEDWRGRSAEVTVIP